MVSRGVAISQSVEIAGKLYNYTSYIVSTRRSTWINNFSMPPIQKSSVH